MDGSAEASVRDGGIDEQRVCLEGETLCGTQCVNLRTSTLHCGACNNACATGANQMPATCMAGVCSRPSCLAGFSDCDGVAANGCEASLSGTANCGTCGNACGSAVPQCMQVNGRFQCVTGCAAGQARCDGACVDIRNNPVNCNACGRICPDRVNATPTCAPMPGTPTCGFRCNTGFADCDADQGNGCERPVSADLNNCGMCNNRCPTPANATPSCTNGTCGFVCNPGFGDCDRMASNGCEASLSSSMNCGMCGRSCSGSTPTCSVMGGAGQCVSACPAGQTLCGGTCVDTTSNVEHCGMCGVVCSSRANTTRQCNSGACFAPCLPGFADCDGDTSNGCETNINTNRDHCGMCNNRCATVSNATVSCSDSRCVIERCSDGFSNCNATYNDGCEINTLSNTSNCGTCGTACGTGGVCQTGMCGCAAGQTSCPGAMGSTTCVNQQTDINNCGACGNVCPSGAACEMGRCRCPAGQLSCGARCVPSDNTNCGACGVVCGAGQQCCSGMCVNTQTDVGNCGMCSRACPVGASCAMGNCACGVGLSLCGGACVPACGSCSMQCGVGAACTLGNCVCSDPLTTRPCEADSPTGSGKITWCCPRTSRCGTTAGSCPVG